MADRGQLEAMAALLSASAKPQPQRKSYVSAEDFITKSALYVRTRVDGFGAPPSISFDCYGECRKETTWYRVHYDEVVGKGSASSEQVADWTLHSLAYKCFACKKVSLTVIYREMLHESRQSDSVARQYERDDYTIHSESIG